MKIKKGTVDFISYFNLVDSAAGTPETALTITNIDATYTRAQAAAVKNDLTALAATTTAHTDNKGIEVDATNAPGLYRIDWPDAAFASGADKVILTVTCSGCAPAHLIVELVDCEPADVQAILGALATSAAAGDPGTTTTLTAYLKQIINTLEGSAGIPTFPAAAVAANNVSLAETIRSIDSRLPAALSSGNLKSDVFAMQTDVISAAAWAQATSDELIARLFASPLPAGNVGEFGNTVTGAAAYAVLAATDTATLLTRVTAAVYGYWLNLNVGGLVASSAEATSIQNNTRVVRVVPSAFERPDSGSTAFVIELALYDEVGNMEAPDSAPTLAVVNQSLTSRNANLDSTTMTLVSTGRYRGTYTIDTNHAIEQLVFAFSVIEGGNTRVYMNTGQVVDTTAVDFTSTDRAALTQIAIDAAAAVKAVDPLNPLNVSATGAAMIDWGNIDSPGATVNLPNTTIGPDIYHADIYYTRDDAGAEDLYKAVWFKNGVRITSGITSPTIQVVKEADGTDLIASTAMTEIGTTEAFKYTATTTARQTAGESCLVTVGATIDAAVRTFVRSLGRDSTA